LIAGLLLLLVILAPLVVADPVLRDAWVTADAAALLAMAAGLPLALGLWAFAGWTRPALGCLIAAVAVAGLLREPAIAAQAALGLPVTVLALLARLRPVAPASLRAAGANGVSPAALWRLVMVPVMLPGLAGGGLIVFAAVLAASLRAGPSAIDWALPVASLTAWMMWLFSAHR